MRLWNKLYDSLLRSLALSHSVYSFTLWALTQIKLMNRIDGYLQWWRQVFEAQQNLHSDRLPVPCVSMCFTHTLQFMHTWLDFLGLHGGFFPILLSLCCASTFHFFFFLPLMVFEMLFVISVSVSWEEKSSTDSMATLKPHTIMFFFLSFFLLLFLYISFNLNYGKPLRSTHFMLWNRILKSCFIQFAQVFRVFFSPSFIHLWSPGFSETMNELIGFYLDGFFRNSINSNILVQRTIIAIYLRDSWEIPIKHLQRSSETFWNVI